MLEKRREAECIEIPEDIRREMSEYKNQIDKA